MIAVARTQVQRDGTVWARADLAGPWECVGILYRHPTGGWSWSAPGVDGSAELQRDAIAGLLRAVLEQQGTAA